MTKPNLTSINILLDGSGSMAPLVNDTIGGVNQFLTDQQAAPGEAMVSLCIFNTKPDIVHDYIPLASVPLLNNKTYKASGGTALLDAVGLSVDKLGEKLSNMKEEDRPSKILFLIITDGEENSSHLLKDGAVAMPSKGFYKNGSVPRFNDLKYPLERIKEMIDHQKSKYNWEFVFMGANIDAFGAGASLGVAKDNTLQYEATSAGTKKLYATSSAATTRFRVGGGSGFFNP
jgi:hypothetical protein